MQSRDPAFAAKVADSFSRQPFMTLLGARLEVVEPGVVVIAVDKRQELEQQHGFVHAGVTGAIVDSACGYAAYSLMPPGSSVLTVEYKLNLLAPAAGERLEARAEVVRAGRTLYVVRGEVTAVTGESRKLCAASLSTIMAMEGQADTKPG